MEDPPKFALKPLGSAFSEFALQPRVIDQAEQRRDWVRAAYIGLLLLLLTGIIIFACYANRFGDWTKAKDLLTVLLPALLSLIAAGTAFYFKGAQSQ